MRYKKVYVICLKSPEERKNQREKGVMLLETESHFVVCLPPI